MNEGILNCVEEILFPKRTSADFKTFVCSPDFCGNPNMYQFWLDESENLPQTVSEIIISGSLGGGKSWFAAFYIGWRLYLLFEGGDPHDKLGIPKDDPVYILYFSVSMTMAKRSGFQYLFNVFKQCKWFKENCPADPNLTSSIRFPNGFSIEYASSEGHQIGLNVWGFILDEANFRAGVGQGLVAEYSEVTNLYTQLIDRQVSRFSSGFEVSALAILLSSASYQSAFVEKRKESIKDDPNSRFVRAVAYKIRPEKYSKEKFEVFVGAGQIEPRILNSPKEKDLILRQLKLDGISDVIGGEYFEEVPTSLKKFYTANISLALQNHSGIPTQIQGKFLKNINIFTTTYKLDLPKFFYQDEITLSTGDDVELIEFVDVDSIDYPERPHSFFFDLSVTGDTGGFSCFRFDGIDERNFRKHTHVFTVGIVPPPNPFATKISKMRTFMNDISEFVNVTAFGTDQFQSTQLRQDINADLDLEDVRLSIDSSDAPHLHWVHGLVDGNITSYYNPKLETEVDEAEHDMKRRRIVKRKGSTDDLFQSCVGAYWLSDTISAYEGDLKSIYGEKVNLVGARSYDRMLRNLGYK